MLIPFNKPDLTNRITKYIADIETKRQLSADGHFTMLCREWLKKELACTNALLTHSCTAALEMASILFDINLGDEIIMPSYTFVSTANAFVLRGAVPVFVDIRPDTLNINENLIESAITKKTKVIVPVHYGGVGCDMDMIMDIAKQYRLKVVEDAAQAIKAKFKNKPLGAFGELSVFSFHETKNVSSGEGGALIINNKKYAERSEIIRDKGTNRKKFLNGEIDKYTWVDKGSSYSPSEIIGAILLAQLDDANEITKRRLQIWSLYHNLLKELEDAGVLKRPSVPINCEHNGHIYYILLKSKVKRDSLMHYLNDNGIQAVFHYIPLHTSPAGKKYTKYIGDMENTVNISQTILRLPIYYELTDEEVIKVVETIFSWVKSGS